MASTGVKLLLLLLGVLSALALETGEPNDLAYPTSRYQVSFMATGLIDSSPSDMPIRKLLFEDVLHNDGNGYNADTGVFTAPLAGLYSFSASYEAEAAGGDNSVAAIFVDGEAAIEGHIPFHLASSKKNLSIQGPVELKRGQEVTFRHFSSREVVFSKAFAHFSGFLVYPNRR